MSTYVIGDIQGCFIELEALLAQIGFRSDEDQLWFSGDLINRGPDSLKTLRFVKSLGEQAVTVLGNHDLHCLAVACGHGRIHKEDTLEELLAAPDAEELLDWLRHRPLMYTDEKRCVSMIHAGLPPQWDIEQARQCAAEVETVLQGDDYIDYFANMYGNKPHHWTDDLQGWERLRFITNCFTRLRYLDADGHPCLKVKGPIGTQPEGYLPWFQAPNRRSSKDWLIFGHWSTLGFYQGDNVVCLDSGCLWGGALTAVRLGSDSPAVEADYHLDCQEKLHPELTR